MLLKADRRLEASIVQVPTLPKVPHLSAWKLALCDEVASALRCPDDGFRWILEVEKESYDDPQCRVHFPTLDTKLAAALSKAITGERCRQIKLEKEHAATCKFLKRKTDPPFAVWTRHGVGDGR